jgi:hypothetical protein
MKRGRRRGHHSSACNGGNLTPTRSLINGLQHAAAWHAACTSISGGANGGAPNGAMAFEEPASALFVERLFFRRGTEIANG